MNITHIDTGNEVSSNLALKDQGNTPYYQQV